MVICILWIVSGKALKTSTAFWKPKRIIINVKIGFGWLAGLQNIPDANFYAYRGTLIYNNNNINVISSGKFCNNFGHKLYLKCETYKVSQNWLIPNSERGREGPSGARKILTKKIALPVEDISTLIVFNT
jgi:hypothetical protein